MTDRLDAIEQALDEGFWDEAGGTDVRWLVGEVRRLRRAESEREDWRTTANNLAALVGKQEADLTALRERNAVEVEQAYRDGLHDAFACSSADPDECWRRSAARKRARREP